MSKSLSSLITVTIESGFVPQQSKPDNNRYVFFYTITIHNDSDIACQLLSRHWVIEDANKNVEEVFGEGVIGEQPLINAGQKFKYTSGAILETEIGTMEGRYFMVKKMSDNSVIEFEIDIPKFTLSIPRTLH